MMDFDGQNIKLSHDQVIMMNIFIQNLSRVTYKYLQKLFGHCPGHKNDHPAQA